MLISSSFKQALTYQNRSIDYFDSRIKQQKELLRAIRAVLPDTLAKHLLHSLLSGKKLLIFTNSAVWAAQLRFHNDKIMSAVAPFSKDPAMKVQIKILAEQTGPSLARSEKANKPSAEKMKALRQHLSNTPVNELHFALGKLAQTLERTDKSNTR